MNHELGMGRSRPLMLKRCAVCVALLFSVALLFLVFVFFLQYAQTKEEKEYISQMRKAYILMEENTDQVKKILSSYSYKAAASSTASQMEKAAEGNLSTMYGHYKENGVIKKLSDDSKNCQLLLSQLPLPSESLKESYSLLLDAHIAYKEYIKLALYPADDSEAVQKERESLEKELEARLEKANAILASL